MKSICNFSIIILVASFFSCGFGTSKNEKLFFESYNIIKDSINESILIDSHKKYFKDSILIDSIFSCITNNVSELQYLRDKLKNVKDIKNESRHFKINAGINQILNSNENKYLIKQVNFYKSDQTLIVYTNDSLKELIFIKAKDDLKSIVYIRKDYFKNKVIFDLTNKILKSKLFVLRVLYKTDEGFKADKFIAPNKADTI